MKTLVNIDKLPVGLIIGNTSDETKTLLLHPDNGEFQLQPEEQIVIRVRTSREYLYYYQQCRDQGLSLAEADDNPMMGDEEASL